jgi:hypothetical protein
VLLLVGAAVIAGALLFGGGFWAGSVVGSVPGTSFDGSDPRVGPGGPGEHRFPGREDGDDSGTDTDSDPTGTDPTGTDTTDPYIVEG